MGNAGRTCPGPAPPAAPPGRWTPAPPLPAAAPCGNRPGGGQTAPAGWGCGTAGVRTRGRVQRSGKVRGLLPVRRLRFLTGRRHLPARPGSGSRSGEPVARRRLGGGSGAGAERGEVHPAAGLLLPGLGARSAVPPAGRNKAWGGGGHTRLGERAPGAAPREGRCPRKGKRCSSLASLPRQLSGPVPNDGELPHPRNDRRRLLWARVQGAPEAQRPGEGRELGLCCVWPGLISGASWVLRLCQAFGTRHPFGFLLTFLTSSCWHCVIWIQGT